MSGTADALVHDVDVAEDLLIFAAVVSIAVRHDRNTQPACHGDHAAQDALEAVDTGQIAHGDIGPVVAQRLHFDIVIEHYCLHQALIVAIAGKFKHLIVEAACPDQEIPAVLFNLAAEDTGLGGNFAAVL